MNGVDQLLNRYTLTSAHRVKSLLSPLTRISGISSFGWFRLNTDRHFSLLSTDPEWNDEYFGDNHHLQEPLYQNSQPIHSQFIFPELLSHTTPDLTLELREKKTNSTITMVHIQEHEGIRTGYFFSAPNKNPNIYLFYINDSALLMSFIEHFNQEMLSLINEMQIFPSFLEKSTTFIPSIEDPLANAHRTQFLKAINQHPKYLENLKLTKREKEILQFARIGMQVPEIAQTIHRSKRTVETHIYHLKEKLLCKTKGQLIQRAKELETAGYL